MRSRAALVLLAVHIAVLLLAATGLSLAGFGGNGQWGFQYVHVSFADGWGREYRSDYTLPVVLTYLLAHLLGLAAYLLSHKLVHIGWIVAGVVLSGLGLASFAIEASHWFASHNRSWIVSAPIASLALAAVVVWLLASQKRPVPLVAG
jgi:hypothetical protein